MKGDVSGQLEVSIKCSNINNEDSMTDTFYLCEHSTRKYLSLHTRLEHSWEVHLYLSCTCGI